MTNKFKNIRAKGLLPLFFLLVFCGCKKESSDIGLGFIPQNGGLNGAITENFIDISCRTVNEDSLKTDSLNTNILGILDDPEFGQSRANLIVQPTLIEFGSDFTSKTLDSITLTLKYDKAQVLGGVENVLRYGDLTSVIEIEVYKLDEVVESDKQYYSNFDPMLGTKVGTFTGSLGFFDSVTVQFDGDTSRLAPQLRFRLDNTFGQDLLDQSATIFNSNDDFLSYLKGLVLVPKSVISGDGVIVGVEAFNSSSNLTLYYDDTLSFNMPMGNISERINYYDIISQPSNITSQKGNTSGTYNLTYIQSLSGAKVKVDVPGIDSIIQRGEKIVINEAKLEVQLDLSTVTSDFKEPIRLTLLQPDSSGSDRSVTIIDYIDFLFTPNDWVGYHNYGGTYTSSENKYEFHFNRHLQQLVDEYIESGNNDFRGFYISIPSDFPITPSRAVLNTDPTNGGIKVSVTYTKLN